MEILEKERVSLWTYRKSDMSFVINNDIELLEKLKQSEKNYQKNWVSYSIIECYNEHTDLINNY